VPPSWQPFKDVRKELKALLDTAPEQPPADSPSEPDTPDEPAPETSPDAPHLQLDDEDLFAMAVGAVEPLRQVRVAPVPPRRDPPSPQPAAADEEADFAAIMDEQEHGQWQASDVSEHAADDLRTGTLTVDRTLDLHGQRRDAANRRVAAGLAEARMRGHRVVLIVHGKGLRSGGDGDVLRQAVRRWLRTRPMREFVLAFAPGLSHEGGSGATRVLIRPN